MSANISIVMLVRDRPNLTRQALDSLLLNTHAQYSFLAVDDNSQPATREILTAFFENSNVEGALISAPDAEHITGRLRNYAVSQSRKYFPDAEWLYLADNDSYFQPNWLQILIDAYNKHKFERFLVVGGQNHPYHKPLGGYERWLDPAQSRSLREYLTLAGTSQFMKWSTWEKYGPLLEGNPGPCNGEDHEFCQKIRADGGKIGAVYPEVVLDCGITQTGGRMSPGADQKKRIKGVIYE